MSGVLYNPAVEQRMMFVRLHYNQLSNDLEEINELLENEWQIASVVPSAASTDSDDFCGFLCILERRRNLDLKGSRRFGEGLE